MTVAGPRSRCAGRSWPRTALLGDLLPAICLALTLTASACGGTDRRQPVEIPATGAITIAAGGDILLTDPLGAAQRDPAFASLRSLLGGATLALANLDVNLLGPEEEKLADVRPLPRWASGGPREAAALRDLGFDVVSLANDHATDYGPEGLRATTRLLSAAGILHAGAGTNVAEARAPVFAGATRRVALVAVATSSLPESRATPARPNIAGRPGLSPLRYWADITVDPKTFRTLKESVAALNAGPPPGEQAFTMFGTTIKRGDRTEVEFIADAADERAVLDEIRAARGVAEVVVVSIHSHEPSNASDAPAEFVQRFARAAIDAGAALVVGHGPHRLRGVELYQDGAILYSLGNFIYQGDGIDDRAANLFDRGTNLYEAAIGAIGGATPGGVRPALDDPSWWEGAVALATFSEGRMSGLTLQPIELGLSSPAHERGVPRLATGARRTAILLRLAALSAPYGTAIRVEDGAAVPKVRTQN